MPNIKSAKKRVLVIEKKTMENKMVLSEVKTAIKKFNAAIENGNVADAEALLPATVSLIDCASAKGVIHKNNAANKKSALAKRLNAAKAAAPVVEEKPVAKKKAAKVEAPAAEEVVEKPKRTRKPKAE